MSRIKSSVKMGQGRRRRACFGWPAAGAAGQFEIAAVTPRRTGAALAAPGWPPSARVSGRRHARCRGWVTAAAWHVRAPCSGRPRSTAGRPRGSGTTGARHALAPRSGPPRSTTRRLGTAAARHTRASPIGPAEVARQHAAEKGGEVKNGACHLSRNNA